MIREDGFLEHHPHCLGCGSENPAGMGLRMQAAEDRILASVRFDRRQEGAPGIAHGGAVATVLDDALGSVLMLLRRPAVTANLNIDYRQPAYLGRELQVEASCTGIDGRKIHLHGVVRDGETTIAEARALFLGVDLEHFRRSGEPLPETWECWPEARSAPAES